MAVRIVRLGSPREQDEGLRIGTVRFPPRGVRKEDLARRDFYDLWLPELAPSAPLVKLGLAADTPTRWTVYTRRYRTEMRAPDKIRLLRLLAGLSIAANFSVGCYCADETRCHRSLLRVLLHDQGAHLAP
ncbi:MAG TPA: DUF488 family protein [Candidatus Polarisedimenticolia bacterium]|nr:DUF488 family protein [Candidatus Polarisedimenticolia bacterium]